MDVWVLCDLIKLLVHIHWSMVTCRVHRTKVSCTEILCRVIFFTSLLVLAHTTLIITLDNGGQIKQRGFKTSTRPSPLEQGCKLHQPERQLTKAIEPLTDLEGGAQGQI